MEEGLKSVSQNCFNYQRQILKTPYVSGVSKFYLACENGDIETVKQMLSILPYNQLNRMEPNGSTSLHAATIAGHLEIVRLLIQKYGCQRHLRNAQGLTAYEEAQTDEMRQLYRRPSDGNRFNVGSSEIKKTFEIVSCSQTEIERNADEDDHIDKPDNRYLAGFETNEEVARQLAGLNGVKTMMQSRLGRFIMDTGMKLHLAKSAGYTEEEYNYVTSKTFRHQAIRKLLDEYVTPLHPEYQKCSHLLDEYIEHDSIESLLKLYSLETPFYHQILILSSPLGFPFFMHLSDMKQRYYQGYSYRGLCFTQHELNEYLWALQRKDSVLALMTFTSTSINRDIAEAFADKYLSSSDQISIILIFHFPQPCDTAINLSAIPQYHLSCVSQYEDEKEVLIAPRTFFKVTAVQTEQLSNHQRCNISLENLCGQPQTVGKALLIFLLDDLKKRSNKLFHH